MEDLTNGLGVSLANVFSGMEFLTSFKPLLRHAGQPVCQDPESGYIRRSLTPQGSKTAAQLVEVLFPAQARITYDITQRDHAIQQQIWIITGQLQIKLGEQTDQLYQ